MGNKIVNGIITAVYRERYEMNVKGQKVFGRLKPAVYFSGKAEQQQEFPTVGDHVEIQYQKDGDSYIIKTYPRSSCFIRRNPSPGMPDQAVAANFDYVFIVMSMNKDFHTTKLERYLTVAWESGGIPVVLLSKSDLCLDRTKELSEVTRIAQGVDVIFLSAKTGEGMEQLSGYLEKGKSAVLLGSSGVGKSSIVNYLLGEEAMETSAIREWDSQGRHTTTHRQSFIVESGGTIIDTPGMRTLAVSDADEGLQMVYKDIEEFMKKCRFRNCSHDKEDGCAVLEALESGLITQKKWENYNAMKREEEYARKRAEYLSMKQMKTKKKYSKKDRKY